MSLGKEETNGPNWQLKGVGSYMDRWDPKDQLGTPQMVVVFASVTPQNSQLVLVVGVILASKDVLVARCSEGEGLIWKALEKWSPQKKGHTHFLVRRGIL